jgi:hypothetical protein
MGLWSEGKPTWVQPLAGDKTEGAAEGADAAAGAAASGTSDEDAKQLGQALEARDKAVQVRCSPVCVGQAIEMPRCAT